MRCGRVIVVGCALSLAACGAPMPPGPAGARARGSSEGSSSTLVASTPPVLPATRLRLVPQIGHTGDPIGFSDDGRLLLTGARSFGVPLLWDTRTWLVVARFPELKNPNPGGFALSPDGKTVYGTDAPPASNLVAVDVATQKKTVLGPPVRTFGLGGPRVVAWTREDELQGLDAATGKVLWRRPAGRPHNGASADAAVVTHDGRFAAVVSGPQSVEVVDATTGATIRAVPGVYGPRAFLRDGRLVLDTPAGVASLELGSGAITPLPGVAALTADGRRELRQVALEVVVTDPRSGGREIGRARCALSDTAATLDGSVLACPSSEGGGFTAFDLASGVARPVRSRPATRARGVAFDAAGRAFFAGGALWETDGLGARFHAPGATAGAFPRGQPRVVYVTDVAIETWTLEGRRLLDLPIDPRSSPVLSPTGAFALWTSASGRTSDLVEIESRRAVHLPVPGLPLAVSSDGRLALLQNRDANSPDRAKTRELVVVDAATTAVVARGERGRGSTSAAAFSPDGRWIAEAREDFPGTPGGHPLDVLDASTLRRIASIPTEGAAFRCAAFSGDGARVIVGDAHGTLRIADARTGVVQKAWRAHETAVDAVALSPDGRLVLSVGIDGLARLARASDGASLNLLTQGDEWLVYSDDGLFDSSRRGGELLAAVDGGDAYRIDQLAVRSNRPDLLLRRLGEGSPDRLSHYAARYEARLLRLGVEGGALGVRFDAAPRARITEVTTGPREATLTAELSVDGSELARYQIFVDDVPLFAPPGKPTAGKKATVRERIELGPGKGGANKIEVSAYAKSGLESLRAVRIVQRTATDAPGDLYFLAFGVSRYANPEYDLGYPAKDATDLAEAFAAASKDARKVHTRVFTDAQATSKAVREARTFFDGATVDDTVVVFVAGHGVHARDATADYYFATHDLDVKDLRRTAAGFDAIEALFQRTRARRRLLLLDTCESGERDPSELGAEVAKAGARGLRARAARGLRLGAEGSGAPARRAFLYERDRFIYNDLTRRTGAIVLSSSRGNELSYELDELQNGAFTESILRGLAGDADAGDKDGWVTSDELRAFVAREVPSLTGDRQHPTVDRDNLEVVLRFAVTPEARAIAARSGPGAPAGGARGLAAPPAQRAAPGCSCRLAEGSASGEPWIVSLLPVAALLARRRSRAPRAG